MASSHIEMKCHEHATSFIFVFICYEKLDSLITNKSVQLGKIFCVVKYVKSNSDVAYGPGINGIVMPYIRHFQEPDYG